ncbi:MAG: F0F1 ATP synthase subunit A [Rickettsiales bacterium]|nr:F0F1 ATP synthase subunit A [Rickettsiales bacterium]
MSHSPLDQFNVYNVFDIKIAGIDISITNSAIFMIIALSFVTLFFMLSMCKRQLIPGRVQASAEVFHNFIVDMLNENTEGKGEKFLPFVFGLFYFILMLNILGMIPHGFTVTSHISITFTLALLVFLLVTIYAFIKHGLKFLHFFVPDGVPMVLLPFMVVIEIFVYFTRPVSLCIRLAANMFAGHVLMFIIAGFVTVMGVWGILPISFITIFTGFELFVAILQAYIFTILSCVYINDAINLH